VSFYVFRKTTPGVIYNPAVLNSKPGRGIALVAAAGLCLAGSLGLRVTAQAPVTAPAAPAKTTAAGVYSAAQASRGERTFGNICQGCHTIGVYTSAKFRDTWNGRPIGELFQLLSETMPEDSPGGLTAGEYAQVIAYILKLNRLPEGKDELPADAAALKDIKFEFSAPSTSEDRQP
jgi:mono/diheme cytochrome c family protein